MYIRIMKDSSQLYKGTLSTIVLKLLSEQKKMYGYEICKRVHEITDGKMNLTEGALYPTLHKLEADDLLTVSVEVIGNRSRKYYSLTQKGKSNFKIKMEEFEAFVAQMQHLLQLKTQL